MNLIDIVEKTHNNPVGTFANIYDDLADVTKKHKLTPMLKMAHAYAKRAAAAGLFYKVLFRVKIFLTFM